MPQLRTTAVAAGVVVGVGLAGATWWYLSRGNCDACKATPKEEVSSAASVPPPSTMSTPSRFPPSDVAPSEADSMAVAPSENDCGSLTDSIHPQQDIAQRLDFSPMEGEVIRRTVKADNSCLFNALGYVLEDKNRSVGGKLRTVVKDAIAADPAKFNSAYLGMSNEAYQDWIIKDDTWGGEIEVAILADHYKSEIAVFNAVSNTSAVYGQSKGYKQRVLLLYDGVHYDPLAVTPAEGAPEEMDVTVFSPYDDSILDRAKKLGQAVNERKQFTDTGSFDLMCGECQEGLRGEAAARAHAQRTGHTNFQQVQQQR